MKVAFLSFDFGEYCIRLASALARQADVLLLLPHQQAAPHLSLLDQTINFEPFHKPRMRQPLQQLWMLRTLMQHIRFFDPDVLHLQQGHLWFNSALPFLKQYPLVLTIHDPRHHVGDSEGQKVPQVIMDFGFRRAARVIVHGKRSKQVVVEDLRLPSEHVHVIPHIVLGDSAAQPQVREDDRLILFFGRIWAYKGLEYLIRAEPLITAQVPDAKIVIAGAGEDFARYRRLMVHPDRFIVHNEYVPHDKRTALFRQASLVVLPYIDASQSGVIPLAYTFAKPVVATTVGSLPEMVEHGHTGYLVPPRDEQALADAIVRLLQDQELRRQYGANGKRKIETECSPSVVAEQTLAVYHCTLHGRQASGEKRRSKRPQMHTAMRQ
jgi:glycosyltransferase involved in cell wall biosynthesis